MESVSSASKDEDTGWEYSSVGACCAYHVRKGFGLIFSIIKIYCVKDQGQFVGVSSFLLPCELQGWNSGRQAWWCHQMVVSHLASLGDGYCYR